MNRRLRYRIEQAIARLAIHLVYGCRVSGMENVPQTGPCIVAANHKANLDPPVIGSHLPREIRYFAKKELFKIPILGPIIRDCGAIPVDRQTSDLRALSRALEILRNDQALLLFPEGTRIRREGLGRPKEGVALLAVQTGVPVVPVHIGHSWEPRRAIFRRIPIEVRFGRPLEFEEPSEPTDRRRLYARISGEIMAAIEGLSGVEHDTP